MRTVALAFVVLGTGCNSLFGNDGLAIALDAAIDAVPLDAPPEFEDAGIDSSEERCVGSYKTLCYLPNQQPTGNVVLMSIDTSVDANCTQVVNQAGGPSLCLVAGTNVTVFTGGAIITGTRPLMLYATDTINVAGELHAGSVHAMGRLGPGANDVSGCNTLNNGGNGGNNAGDGGGAGGSFGTRGGDGGRGARSNGGAGGISGPAITTLVGIRGGCRGTKGGGGQGPQSGAPGNSGGAVYLLAGMKITVGNRVIASGAGGSGADGQEGGGGGGGSGGMIVLEAPVVEIAGAMAELNANGGGGGEGTVNGSAADGEESPAWDENGDGGEGRSQEGGNGGDGAAGSAGAEAGNGGTEGSSNADGGGGGGGGGLGVILIKTPILIGAQVGNISPAHRTTPTKF